MENKILSVSYGDGREVAEIYRSLTFLYMKSCKPYEALPEYDARPTYFGNTANAIQSFWINWQTINYLCQNKDKRVDVLGDVNEEKWEEMMRHHINNLISDLYISCFSQFEDFIRRIDTHLQGSSYSNPRIEISKLLKKFTIPRFFSESEDKSNYFPLLEILGSIRNSILHNSGRCIDEDKQFTVTINNKKLIIQRKKNENFFFFDGYFLADVLTELHTFSTKIVENKLIKSEPLIKSALDGYLFSEAE